MRPVTMETLFLETDVTQLAKSNTAEIVLDFQSLIAELFVGMVRSSLRLKIVTTG